jgi:cytochrome c oxidase subunit II
MTTRPSRSRRSAVRRIAGLAPVGSLLLLSACASDAPQDTLEPEGPIARTIDNLVNPVFIVAGVVFLLVEVGTVLLVRKFRARPDQDPDDLPAQTHGNTKLELAWTIAPAVLLAVIGLATVVTLFEVEAAADDAEMSVTVIGQQWWWAYEYDVDGDDEADIVTANDLVIPAGTPVRLEIESRDVIHSYWIPKLNGKKDAVPGRVHELTVESDEAGTFVGQCTEYCGLSHAYMRQRLVALDGADYDAWVENQLQDAEMPTDEQAQLGAELFTGTCSRCHLARGINDEEFEEQGGGDDLVSGPGPDLTHFATRGSFAGAIFNLWETDDPNDIVQYDEIGGTMDTEALEAWLRNPPEEKPMSPADPEEGGVGRGMPNLNLTEDQIDQLVAFFETLD